jgi:hypothetical protein
MDLQEKIKKAEAALGRLYAAIEAGTIDTDAPILRERVAKGAALFILSYRRAPSLPLGHSIQIGVLSFLINMLAVPRQITH